MCDGRYISAKNKDVLIIGGGDTGNDCVATCIRHGAHSVNQLEIMPKPSRSGNISNPWPAWPKAERTGYGHEESIAVFGYDPREYQTTVKSFSKDKNGYVNKAILVKIDNGIELPGSEKIIDTNLIIIAAGFLGCDANLAKIFGISLDNRGNILTVPRTYHTGNEKIFSAGDMRRGQSLVVWAIKEGREVAKEVDTYLMGYSNLY